MIKKLLFIINMFMFLINMTFLYFVNYIFNNNYIRNFFTNLSYFFIKNAIKNILNKTNVIILSNPELIKNKINIINSNHSFQFDIFLLFYLFKINKIIGKQISSVSTNKNIGFFDKIILNGIKAMFVNNSHNCINNINNTFDLWYKRNYKSYIITFLEGIAKCDYYGNTKYTNLFEPKSLCLSLLNKKGIKYINDINIVYTSNNKILNCSNAELYNKLFNNDVKIYIQINKYKLPKNEFIPEWTKQLYKIKDEQINLIIKKFNIKK